MTVAFDAFSNVAADTGNLSWTHTPTGTPRGVIVQIAMSDAPDQVSGVTYGGVNMTEVAGSPNSQGVGENTEVYTYFLGSNIPTGAQTIYVTVSGSAGKRAGCVTVTAGNNTEIQDSDGTINSNSIANPSVTLSLGGKACFCAIVFYSGQDAITGITPLTNWTTRLEHDSGFGQSAGWYTYDIIGTSDVTAGWTQTTEDAVAIAIAINEVASTPKGLILMMGDGGFL